MPKKNSGATPIIFTSARYRPHPELKKKFYKNFKSVWDNMTTTSPNKGITASKRGNAAEIQLSTPCNLKGIRYTAKLTIGQYTLPQSFYKDDALNFDANTVLLNLRELAEAHLELYKYFNPIFRGKLDTTKLSNHKVKLSEALEHTLLELAKDKSYVGTNTLHIYVKTIIEEILDYKKPSNKQEFLEKINKERTISITPNMQTKIHNRMKSLRDREDNIFIQIQSKNKKLRKFDSSDNIDNTLNDTKHMTTTTTSDMSLPFSQIDDFNLNMESEPSSKFNLEDLDDLDLGDLDQDDLNELGDLELIFDDLDDEVSPPALGKHELEDPTISPGGSSTKKTKKNLPG